MRGGKAGRKGVVLGNGRGRWSGGGVRVIGGVKEEVALSGEGHMYVNLNTCRFCSFFLSLLLDFLVASFVLRHMSGQ